MSVGTDLLLRTKYRLAEATGVSVETGREAELYNALTEARDDIRQRLAIDAPLAVQALPLVLEQDLTDPNIWSWPSAAPDYERVITVRPQPSSYRWEHQRRPLDPAVTLGFDGGQYEWLTPRSLRLNPRYRIPAGATGGIEVIGVPFWTTAVTSATTAATVGLPQPTWQSLTYMAAALVLSADEETNPAMALGMAEKGIKRLESLYGDYDTASGMAAHHGFMASVQAQWGDML